jgi:hypothetical protein
MDDSTAQLRRLDRCKRNDTPAGASLGEEMIALYHRQVERRQAKLAVLADCWCRVMPEPLLERCALESFHRGRLTVIVDSAPHLYQIKQLLLAGLEAQMLAACRGAGLRRIVLKRGRWYDDRGRARF